ncbi:MAG: nitrite/sulfite reductase, partial [Deltaproteobacteria bacterium]|nr:nitrite/sulfite reductase [Deltaproteobacteria bacterium]
TDFLADVDRHEERPIRPAGKVPPGPTPAGFDAWRRTNVYQQKQPGYVVATVTLPLGDFTAEQGRALADIARRFTGDTMRVTVDQNLCFRWVSEADLVDFYGALAALGLAAAGAGTIGDVTSCPGTDTCKLGISSSRGLAAELRRQLAIVPEAPSPADALHVKCSGCFNSCGQHHVADLGFLGVSRQMGTRRVPHFQVVVGGEWEHNAGTYGLAIGAVPSKNVPEVARRLRDRYVAERVDGEGFKDFVNRIGKKAVRAMLEDLMAVPAYDVDPSYYSDWGDPREYTIGDMGEGECAGEVVSFAQMGLAAAEREVFEAQLLLDERSVEAAAARAYAAMVSAARALTREVYPNLGDDPDEVVAEFRTRLHDTKIFHDPFAGAKFAQMLLRAHDARGSLATTVDAAHHLVEEAQLFVEAAYACYQRMVAARSSAAE